MKVANEKELEKKCINYARSEGFVCWKNENNGNCGIPDFSILLNNRVFLIEFKNGNRGVLSGSQKEWKNRFSSIVAIIDNYIDFQTLIRKIKFEGLEDFRELEGN